MGEFAIGQGVSRFEDPRLVRGAGHYVDDIQLPGMAHGVVLRSPHAHARITSIDTAAAKAAPGVLAVLTAADIKAAGLATSRSPAGRRSGTARRPSRRAIRSWPTARCAGSATASPSWWRRRSRRRWTPPS